MWLPYRVRLEQRPAQGALSGQGCPRAGSSSAASQEVPLVLPEMTQLPARDAALAPLLGDLHGRGIPFSAHSWLSPHPCCHGKLLQNEAIKICRNQILLSEVLPPADTSECGMNTVSSFWNEGFSISNWDQFPLSWGLKFFFFFSCRIHYSDSYFPLSQKSYNF